VSSLASKPISALTLALVACVPDAPERFVQHPPALAGLRLRAPDTFVASYEVAFDRWVVATSVGHALIDVAPRAGTAGPDALRHVLEVEGRTPVALETRESLSDGFATTLVVHAASPQRVTIVVRELGSMWLRCVGDATLCKSLKRG
jgi:hypothetical protein